MVSEANMTTFKMFGERTSIGFLVVRCGLVLLGSVTFGRGEGVVRLANADISMTIGFIPAPVYGKQRRVIHACMYSYISLIGTIFKSQLHAMRPVHKMYT